MHEGFWLAILERNASLTACARGPLSSLELGLAKARSDCVDGDGASGASGGMGEGGRPPTEVDGAFDTPPASPSHSPWGSDDEGAGAVVQMEAQVLAPVQAQAQEQAQTQAQEQAQTQAPSQSHVGAQAEAQLAELLSTPGYFGNDYWNSPAAAQLEADHARRAAELATAAGVRLQGVFDPPFGPTPEAVLHYAEYGAGAGDVTGKPGTTCCSQFDSNT